jgi:UDP-N-acetylglucosamine acyltransferase
MSIHPTAIIEPGAQIADGVHIGPYSLVGANVVLEAGVKLHGHVNVAGRTAIGEGTEVFPFASLGTQPQDLKFNGEESILVIGKRCKIREHVTMNPGTEGGGMTTKVGDDCLFMMGSHVAHDCQVGNRVILANNATLAGHVMVGDGAIIGGLSAIHQFVRIGRNAIIGGMSGVEKDVIPYGSVMGERADLAGLNLVGLKRRNVDREAIHALRSAYKDIFEDNEGILAERIRVVRNKYDSAEVEEMLDFLEADTSRSFCTPKNKAA